MDLRASIGSRNSSFYCYFAYRNLAFSLLPFSMKHCFLSLTYILKVGNLVMHFGIFMSLSFGFLLFHVAYDTAYVALFSAFLEKELSTLLLQFYLYIDYWVQDPGIITCSQNSCIQRVNVYTQN